LAKARLNDFFDFHGSLLVCVNSIIFPVVLAHEFWMWVQTGPVVLGIVEDAFNVHVMLASTSFVQTHSLICGPLVVLQLLHRLLVYHCKVRLLRCGWDAACTSILTSSLWNWNRTCSHCLSLRLQSWKNCGR